MRNRYPQELKDQVVSEYVPNQCGYKRLAKKYDLSRDTIREWVLAKKRKENMEVKNKSEEIYNTAIL